MKKIISTLIALLAIVGAQAAIPYYYSLEITKKSGEKVVYKFADEPVATFSGTDMNITTKGNPAVAYPTSDIAKMTLLCEENPAGIDNTTVGAKTAFAVDSQTLYAEGLNAGAEIAVYALNGIRMIAANADADGAAAISIANLPAGTYIVATPGQSFKFIK